MPIAIQRRDGGVSILRLIAQPSADDPTGTEPISDDDYPTADDLRRMLAMVEAEIEKWRGVHVGEYVAHHVIDEADIPADRTFRNAWASDGKTIVHDMAKARDIHREAMRRARAPLLASLDIAYQRADEVDDGATKADVASKKQELRDVTAHPGIDAAQTPEQLKAVWPDCLN
jgi:hypothetical protein